MPPEGFELTISAGERPKTYTLDGTATGTGNGLKYAVKMEINYGSNMQLVLD
jgi:hypothetical protein